MNLEDLRGIRDQIGQEERILIKHETLLDEAKKKAKQDYGVDTLDKLSDAIEKEIKVKHKLEASIEEDEKELEGVIAIDE